MVVPVAPLWPSGLTWCHLVAATHPMVSPRTPAAQSTSQQFLPQTDTPKHSHVVQQSFLTNFHFQEKHGAEEKEEEGRVK